MIKKHYPVNFVSFLILLFMGNILIKSDYNPLVFVEIGTKFSVNDPNGNEGYDGQFVYSLAQELSPEKVSPHLDIPAYRYQRILLPILARLITFGQTDLIVWAIPAVLVLSHILGVWAVSQLLISWGRNPWLSVVYGLWIGFLYSLRLDLPEPLAYGLVAAALLSQEKDKKTLSWIFYGLAIFAKEVTLIFLLAQLVNDLLQKKWKDILGLSLVALLPFAIFQVWIFQNFGSFGIGSGGANATAFELIPFMGIFRIGYYSMGLLVVFLILYIPSIIFPIVWGTWKSLAQCRENGVDLIALGLFLNAIILLFIPFSSYREPNATFRIISGLILSLILFSAKFGHKKTVRYSYLYLVLNIFVYYM